MEKIVETITVKIQFEPAIKITFWTAVKLRILGGRRALAQILNRLIKDQMP